MEDARTFEDLQKRVEARGGQALITNQNTTAPNELVITGLWENFVYIPLGDDQIAILHGYLDSLESTTPVKIGPVVEIENYITGAGDNRATVAFLMPQGRASVSGFLADALPEPAPDDHEWRLALFPKENAKKGEEKPTDYEVMHKAASEFVKQNVGMEKKMLEELLARTLLGERIELHAHSGMDGTIYKWTYKFVKY